MRINFLVSLFFLFSKTFATTPSICIDNYFYNSPAPEPVSCWIAEEYNTGILTPNFPSSFLPNFTTITSATPASTTTATPATNPKSLFPTAILFVVPAAPLAAMIIYFVPDKIKKKFTQNSPYKLPDISIIFWILKISCNMIQTAFMDYEIEVYKKYSYIPSIIFTFVLLIQIFLKEYHPIVYWFLFLTSNFTAIGLFLFLVEYFSNNYLFPSIILTSSIILLFTTWHCTDSSMQIVHIKNKFIECVYWGLLVFIDSQAAILSIFIFSSENLYLDELRGLILTTCILLLISGFYFFCRVNQILLFWVAFLVTQSFTFSFYKFLVQFVNPLIIFVVCCSLLFISILIDYCYIAKIKQEENYIKNHVMESGFEMDQV